MRQLIGLSADSNSRSVKFGLQLSTDSPHPCRISWRTIKRTINPWPMKSGVTPCPRSMLKTKVIGQQPRSIILPLLERPLYLTKTSISGLWWRRSQFLVSYAPTRDPIKSCISTTVPSTTPWFSIRQEWLSGSICRIFPRTIQACIPTGPSKIKW